MNDEQFEHAIGHFIPETQEQIRARDTAQREAIDAWKAAHAREATALAQAWEQRDAAQAQLAQLQAEMPDFRANMTKALDLLQVLTSTKYTDRAFVEAVDEADEMLEQPRGKVVLKGLGDQQEAQAAAHGDDVVAVVGTVPDGSGCKSLDFKVDLQDLPDGTRLYAQDVGGGST